MMHEGRIGRALREHLLTHPDEAFSTDELCEHCYMLPVERKHRVAVLRAIDKVLADLPNWTGRRGLDKILVFFNAASVESTAKGDFKRHNLRWARDRQQWNDPDRLAKAKRAVQEHLIIRHGIDEQRRRSTDRLAAEAQDPVRAI